VQPVPVDGYFYKKLTPDNFLLYAAHYYADTQATGIEDFHQDLETFKYIKKILKRHSNTGSIKERLVVNHIIMLTNVFGVFPAVRMLFYKVNKEHHSLLKTFLVYLKYLTPIHAYYLFTYDSININEIAVDKGLLIQLHKNEYDMDEEETVEDDESY